MTVEELITKLRQQPPAEPICWIVCLEDLPLQGVPPGGKGAHLMVFSSLSQANAFILARQKYYQGEKLSPLGIGKLEDLQALIPAPSASSSYETPNRGLLLNFSYQKRAAERTLTWQDPASELNPETLESWLNPKKPAVGEMPKPVATASDKTNKIVLGVVAAVVLLLCCLALGIVGWMNRDKLSFNLAPTKIPPTATPTLTPTVTPTPSPHILVHEPPAGAMLLEDNFDINDKQWVSYYARPSAVKDGELKLWSSEKDYVNMVWCKACDVYSGKYYFQADVRMEKFSQLSHGLAFSITEGNNYYIFMVNQNSFTYSLLKLVNDEWLVLVEDTSSNAIHGYPKSNTLSVYFDQGQIELYINGEEVNKYFDDEPFNGGRIGFIVDGAGANMLADNVFAYKQR